MWVSSSKNFQVHGLIFIEQQNQIFLTENIIVLEIPAGFRYHGLDLLQMSEAQMNCAWVKETRSFEGSEL